MLIDLSVNVTAQHRALADKNEKMVNLGHLGTHFDVMNKEFPLSFTRRNAIVFDVSHVEGRDITQQDFAISEIKEAMFVAFQTGMLLREPYGTNTYFKEHPQLSNALIDALLDRKVSIIGIDCAGVRRGKEHTPKDQYCADRGVFVIENLCHMEQILNGAPCADFIAHTYPIHFADMTGLPCRVVAELPE